MRALALMLSAVLLVAAGCGGKSEEEKFVEQYRPLNDRLIAVSQEISDSLAGAGGGSLGAPFDLQIAQLETVNHNIENLDPPDELRDESRTLTRRIAASVATLRKISTAVQDGKQSEAEKATVELATHAQSVNDAQRRLARATGARVR